MPAFADRRRAGSTRHYVTYLWVESCIINTLVVIAVDESRDWCRCSSYRRLAKYVLNRMGMVKRRANTKAKVTVEPVDELKKLFFAWYKECCLDGWSSIRYDNQLGPDRHKLCTSVVLDDGRSGIGVSWDLQKRRWTAAHSHVWMFMSGDFLPPQLVYQGKTKRCLPRFEYLPNWDITFTENQWSNEDTTHPYIVKILLLYLQQKRKELGLSPDYRALLICDNFKVQWTKKLLKLLDSNSISINLVMVQPNCTDRLQLLDVSVNKPEKNFSARNFNHGMHRMSVPNWKER